MPQLAAALRRSYSHLAKDLLAPLLELMNVGRATCDGDLDRLLIVLVVAMRTVEDRRITDYDLEGVLSGEVDSIPSLSTNVRSIADSTGIPKESVRRKVAALVEAGWIVRHENSLSLAPHAVRMMTDFREQLFTLVERYGEIVRGVRADQDR